MGEVTKIEWTATTHADGTVTPGATFNPWWGCVRVSPACTYCYAADLDRRYGGDHWGKDNRRRFFGEAHWNEPIKWHRKAQEQGKRVKVFCASMADVFEQLPKEHPDAQKMTDERVRLWLLIEATPWLDWLLLTKRPENAPEMVLRGWCNGWPRNVWVGTTVEDQKRADERIPHLLRIPAAVRFLSCEPLFEQVDLTKVAMHKGKEPHIERWIDALAGTGVTCDNIQMAEVDVECNRIDWVIAGGESGPKARPNDPDHFRSLRDQCVEADVPFFFKQWGEWAPEADGELGRVGKKAAGRVLDGRTWDEMPDSYKVIREGRP